MKFSSYPSVFFLAYRKSLLGGVHAPACGLKRKGLRPLHASPGSTCLFFDRLHRAFPKGKPLGRSGEEFDGEGIPHQPLASYSAPSRIFRMIRRYRWLCLSGLTLKGRAGSLGRFSGDKRGFIFLQKKLNIFTQKGLRWMKK